MSKHLTQAQTEKAAKVVAIFSKEVAERLITGNKETVNFELVVSEGGVRRFDMFEKPSVVKLM